MKKNLREKMILEKSKLDRVSIQSQSKMILDHFLQLDIYAKSSQIYCYVAFNQEVETEPLILQALADNKKVAVPKITNGVMDFYYIHSLQDLKLGYFNILEPVTKEKAQAREAIMILPGLAFDTQYNRLGYGGGYYDRYLELHNNTRFHKIAFSYNFQIVSNIEIDVHDKKVEVIITPNGILS